MHRRLAEFRVRLDAELHEFLLGKRDAAVEEAPEALELVGELDPYVLRGGKRLRPALVYHSYRACGGEDDTRVLPAALAVELLHTYLLIHDDIMDQADTRRGEPSAHLLFRDAHRSRGWSGDALAALADGTSDSGRLNIELEHEEHFRPAPPTPTHRDLVPMEES